MTDAQSNEDWSARCAELTARAALANDRARNLRNLRVDMQRVILAYEDNPSQKAYWETIFATVYAYIGSRPEKLQEIADAASLECSRIMQVKDNRGEK